MSATASPPKPRPSGPRPGERSMPWQCAHCRWQSTAFYQNADVDLVKCPKCKVMSIYIIGDLRELARYPEELRYVATGEEPTMPIRLSPQPRGCVCVGKRALAAAVRQSRAGAA